MKQEEVIQLAVAIAAIVVIVAISMDWSVPAVTQIPNPPITIDDTSTNTGGQAGCIVNEEKSEETATGYRSIATVDCGQGPEVYDIEFVNN